jgi:ribose/xylose/arabinose/galactoside ABC-type transport system permease subunit
LLLHTAVVGTAAVGATWIIVGGGIDLSVGSTIACGAMVIALLLDRGASPALAALGGVAFATAIGLVIGLLVTGKLLRVPLPPFIVTLGMWGAVRGLAKGLGNSTPIRPVHTGWIEPLMDPSRRGSMALLPVAVWILLGLAALGALALRYTVLGRHVIAVGSNEENARLCGVRVVRTKLLIYALGVGCAGVAALLAFAEVGMGDPVGAQGLELKIIAAAVIGGASLSGGEGSMLGTLIGALLMTVVDNGCTKLGLDEWVQEIVTGAIILGAVALDRRSHPANR